MDQIGVRELRQHASVYLERVKKGESIEVTERGVPIAVLGPIAVEKPSILDRLIAEGRATPAKRDLAEWLEKNPPVKIEGVSLSDDIIAARENERY